MDGAGVPSPGAGRALAFGSFALQGENHHTQRCEDCLLKFYELATRLSEKLDITATYVTINQNESENVHRLARFNCETISYGSLEFVWTEAFPCFWHSNVVLEQITEAGIDLFYNNICPGFSQGQKKAFLSVHLFQNCRVKFCLMKISSYIHHDHTHAHCDDDQRQVSWKAVPSNVKLRSGSHSERLSGHWIMCR